MCEMTQEAMREKSNKIHVFYHSSYMDFPKSSEVCVSHESLMKSTRISRGRSKDKLGQTGHARRRMRLKLTQKSLLLGICPTKSPIIPNERKGSGFIKTLQSVTCTNEKVGRT